MPTRRTRASISRVVTSQEHLRNLGALGDLCSHYDADVRRAAGAALPAVVHGDQRGDGFARDAPPRGQGIAHGGRSAGDQRGALLEFLYNNSDRCRAPARLGKAPGQAEIEGAQTIKLIKQKHS